MDDLKISQATLDDKVELEKLVHCCYRSETSRKGWTTYADIISGTRVTPGMIEEDMKQPDSIMYKVTDNHDKIIGCVYAQKQQSKMYCGMMCVHPDNQAGGLGRKLLDRVNDYAKSKSCDAVKLEVVNARKELIAWYERRGFVRTGVTEPFPLGVGLGTPTYRWNLCTLRNQCTNAYKKGFQLCVFKRYC